MLVAPFGPGLTTTEEWLEWTLTEPLSAVTNYTDVIPAGGYDVGRRNPILLIGEPVRQGFTLLSNELIRDGGNDSHLGADGLLVMAYLLSCATPAGSGKRVWETSAAQMSEMFGWPGNRRRITKAIEAAKKDGRLLVREYVRDGKPVPRRCAYVVCVGGRRFTDGEASFHSAPIELDSKDSERFGEAS